MYLLLIFYNWSSANLTAMPSLTPVFCWHSCNLCFWFESFYHWFGFSLMYCILQFEFTGWLLLLRLQSFKMTVRLLSWSAFKWSLISSPWLSTNEWKLLWQDAVQALHHNFSVRICSGVTPFPQQHRQKMGVPFPKIHYLPFCFLHVLKDSYMFTMWLGGCLAPAVCLRCSQDQ